MHIRNITENGVGVIKKRLVYICLLLLIIVSFAAWKLNKDDKNVESTNAEKVNKVEFIPKGISPGNFSEYDIKLTMTPDGEFQLKSTVLIKNISKDNWENLIFYFIPNMFTKSVSPHLEHPSAVNFHRVSINGEKVNFILERDTLNIPLVKKLEPDQEIRVDFSYDFTLPENGLRFTKNNGSYYLAQFYPMVATYRNHKWNKKEYRSKGETYHTAFSNFKVTYDVPNEYTLASTSDNDKYPSESKGVFEVENVKEIFITILKEPMVIQKTEGNINIRVFGMEKNEELYKEISEEASAALNYFQKKIGPYPFKQLDIVLDAMGMEYPGIVTAGSIYDSAPVSPNSLKHMIVHEIAHQWFYGVISNDPYNDAWLDEGFADFSTALYYFDKLKQDVPYESIYKQIEYLEPLPINLPLDKYESNLSSYIYGKSNVMLWKIFEKRGEKKEAEKFLKNYYHFYNFKEVNTKEFVRFTKYYFNLNDDSEFKDWLELDGSTVHE
ncbi:M1 family metallopeptidase [Peribacillus loiseleuriae]|uniref:M1 family metallopeptidase n=1 Tax=Peribacillus loiseleuriae TaxID=1679170 RepID=UPI003D04A674